MKYMQEKTFIRELESLVFSTQELSEQKNALSSWQNELQHFLQNHVFDRQDLKEHHPLWLETQQFTTKKESYLPAWEQSKKDLTPAINLAESFADKLMFLVFGKFNAGKSSFCNLIAERFKFHKKNVQPFILENDQIHFHDQLFQEGSTETTAHIQGVILDDHLVLIDTPGLHSITAENHSLTQHFLESADGILWLSSSTSPGQVKELQELAQEIRRRKPLLPIITRSDYLDEVFVDNDIKKILCNKSPENRALQEEDVLERAQEKLNSLDMDPDLVQRPYSISVFYARENDLTDEALANAGLYQVYQALLDLSAPVVAYKERKPLEVLMHYLEEVVLSDIDELRNALERLKSLYLSEKQQLVDAIETLKNSVWQNALSKLPTFMDKLITSISEQPTTHFNRDYREEVNDLLKEAINKNLTVYEIDLQALLSETHNLASNIVLDSKHYEKFYLDIEDRLQRCLIHIGNLLTTQCENALKQLKQQFDSFEESLKHKKTTLLQTYSINAPTTKSDLCELTN